MFLLRTTETNLVKRQSISKWGRLEPLDTVLKTIALGAELLEGPLAISL